MRQVDVIPSISLRHPRRPKLAFPVSKQTLAYITRLLKVNFICVGNQLKIDKIMRSSTSFTCRSMEFLCNLKRNFHQGKRTWHREAKLSEVYCEVFRHRRHFRLVGVTNFIMSDLKANRAP